MDLKMTLYYATSIFWGTNRREFTVMKFTSYLPDASHC